MEQIKTFIIKGDVAFSTGLDNLTTIKDGYIYCNKGRVKGVYDHLPCDLEELPIKDYSGKLVIPGMVDLHIHAPQFTFRGMNMDEELMEWLSHNTFPEEAKYKNPEYAKKAYSIFVNALRKSATTRACIFGTQDIEATNILIDLLEESGLKTYVGKVIMDTGVPEEYEASLLDKADNVYEDVTAWIENTRKRAVNTKPILTPRFVPACTKETLKILSKIEGEGYYPVQSHLCENPEEIKFVLDNYPEHASYTKVYDDYGLLKQNTIMAHCVYCDEEEIKLLKARGTFVAHCPSSNMNLSSGIAPIRRYLSEGINVGLGSDVAGGESESLFGEIKKAIECSKLYFRYIDKTSAPLKFREAFYMATLGGGSFFNIAQEDKCQVGSFMENFHMDCVVIDDSVEEYINDLSIEQRLERAVYLGLDKTGLVHKYVSGVELF